MILLPGQCASTPTPADVDWSAISDAAANLAKTGRDLRVLVIVARALTNINGLAGLTAGLNLLCDTLNEYWDTVHPLLRDRDDPKQAALRRSNCLKQIENDDNGLLGDLEMNPILTLPGIGMITGQNLCDASKTEFAAMNDAPSGLSANEKEKVRATHDANQNRVMAACRAVAAEQADLAASLKHDVVAAQDALTRLQSAFSTKAGLTNGNGTTFPELTQFLKCAQAMMETGMVVTDSTQAKVTSPQAKGAPPATGTTASAGTGTGEIRSRADVEHYLGQIIDFYERTEPSSPIPHLARRVRRMVHMDFVELMSEVAPSGMKEFRNAAGVPDDKGK